MPHTHGFSRDCRRLFSLLAATVAAFCAFMSMGYSRSGAEPSPPARAAAPAQVLSGCPQSIDSTDIVENTLDDFTQHKFNVTAGPRGSVADCVIERKFARPIGHLKVSVEEGHADDIGFVGTKQVTHAPPSCVGVGRVQSPVDVTTEVTLSADKKTARFTLRAKENCCCFTGWGNEPQRLPAKVHWEVEFCDTEEAFSIPNIVGDFGCGGAFGAAPLNSWEDTEGNKFELTCRLAGSLMQFQLDYVTAGGSRKTVGGCPWCGGRNGAKIIATLAEPGGDALFSCFPESFWRSQEAGPEEELCPDEGEAGVIDWRTFHFDVVTGVLRIKHFVSLDGYGGILPDYLRESITTTGSAPPDTLLPSWRSALYLPAGWGRTTSAGGRMTAVNVNGSLRAPAAGQTRPPMIGDPFIPCDIDRDKDCDAADVQLATRLVGECETGDNFNEPADADHDGCITTKDREILFGNLIMCPANVVTPSEPGRCGARVNFDAPAPGVACKPASGSFFPVGTTSVACAGGGKSSCAFTVTVNDAEAPQITAVSAKPSTLWPPNHRMIDVTLDYSVSDNCEAGDCVLSVSSDEPTDGTGEGDTSPDWEVLDARRVRLRAERAGGGDGRVYTITVTCKDKAGGTSSKVVTVNVPDRALRSSH